MLIRVVDQPKRGLRVEVEVAGSKVNVSLHVSSSVSSDVKSSECEVI